MRAKQGQLQSYMRLQEAACRTTCFDMWRGVLSSLFWLRFPHRALEVYPGTSQTRWAHVLGPCPAAAAPECTGLGNSSSCPPCTKGLHLWMESWWEVG